LSRTKFLCASPYTNPGPQPAEIFGAKMIVTCYGTQQLKKAVACRGGGERGDGPGHPNQGGIERMKLQKLNAVTR